MILRFLTGQTSNDLKDWRDLLISFCFNLKLIRIINLLIWFTPRKMRCICSFFALKSKVNITLIIHTWKDFFCSCKIGINKNVKAAFFFWAAIQKLLKPMQILSIFTNRYWSFLQILKCLCHTLTQHHILARFLLYTKNRNTKNNKFLLRNESIKWNCENVWTV